MSASAVDIDAVTLLPLRRLAPSRYTAFKDCPLREVYSTTRIERLLPRAAASYLGTAIHRLLEFAAAPADEPLSSEVASRVLDRFVAEQESIMEESPTDQLVLPISTHVRDFEVRRRRAIAAAVQSAAKPGVRPVCIGRSSVPRRHGSEVWVASADGLIGGYIDEVAQTSDGVLLRDYKTGLAGIPGTPEADEAWEQLALYAALYAEATGVWPTLLEVVPLEGAPSESSVRLDACRALLREAKALLLETNAVLESTPHRQAAEVLARPDPDTCRRCGYRPTCPVYIRQDRPNDATWPNDIIGTVRARHPLRNGRLLFEITDAQGVLAVVRGVSDDADRHPAIALLQPGTRCGLFSLSGNRQGGAFTETDQTTVIVYP